jgi:hypothetical protein
MYQRLNAQYRAPYIVIGSYVGGVVALVGWQWLYTSFVLKKNTNNNLKKPYLWPEQRVSRHSGPLLPSLPPISLSVPSIDQ